MDHWRKRGKKKKKSPIIDHNLSTYTCGLLLEKYEKEEKRIGKI
jgi:hypothetical protein